MAKRKSEEEPDEPGTIPAPGDMATSTMMAFFHFCEEQGVNTADEVDWWAWWEFWYDGYKHATENMLDGMRR